MLHCFHGKRILSHNDRIINTDSIMAGDVLLCCGEGKIGKLIKKQTGSDYTHAAICYSANEIVEAVSSGVRKVPLVDIINRYSHIAVLRQPDAWSGNQVEAMRLFLDEVITSKRKYNLKGLCRFVKNKKKHDISLPDKIKAYFDNQLQPDSYVKVKYFCSELVADCFVATGFIKPSAAIIYKSKVYAPGDLGNDPTFGTFLGYLVPCDGYNIPAKDVFMSCPTFADIFEA